MALLCRALAGFLIVTNLHAGELVDLYTPDTPPLSANDFADESSSVAISPILNAIAATGREVQLIYLPWPRSQRRVAKGADLLIAPLARTKSRENLFTWIAPIMTMDSAFFSIDTPVSDYSQAILKYRRVGVGLGTAHAERLKKEGFRPEQIVNIKLGENPTKLLALHRIDAWFTGVPEGLYLWEKYFPNADPLQMSPPLFQTTLYLACSKSCSYRLINSLRLALENSAISNR